jgi:hypothetical protein
MALIALGTEFPRLPLADLEGREASPDWAKAPSLVILGHRNCKTTRETLRYVDRIHARRQVGSVFAILQDDPEGARELLAEYGFMLPVRLERDPYPVAAALGVTTVPTLFLVDVDGRVASLSEAFERTALDTFAARLGVPAPLFTSEDKAPAFKPG